MHCRGVGARGSSSSWRRTPCSWSSPREIDRASPRPFPGTIHHCPRSAVRWRASFADANTDAVIYPVLAIGLSAVPVGIGIGILRFGLFDIELVLSRALTYAVLTVGVI